MKSRKRKILPCDSNDEPPNNHNHLQSTMQYETRNAILANRNNATLEFECLSNPQEIHHASANVQSPVTVADGSPVISSSLLRMLQRFSHYSAEGAPGPSVGLEQVLSQGVTDDPNIVGTSSSSRGLRQNNSANAQKSTANTSSYSSTPTYMDLGDCDQVCEYCGALFWYEERLKGYSPNIRPKYNRCCRGGRVRLPLRRYSPQPIKELFRDNHFMENIRAYNLMFAMTSFGAKVDDSINNGSGPYVFKVEGQISHWMGSLCPPDDRNPRFLQMYIYDTYNEVSNRLRYFGGDASGGSKTRNRSLLIDEVNDLVRLFRTARDMRCHQECHEFKIRLYNSGNQMRYDAPASGTLGEIVYDDGPRSKNDFDIIIYMKDRMPQRINKLHPSYMALQFPLLFPFS